jgi:hypothetical protein
MADSPASSARRSALETTFSRREIGSRWLTPERLSIFESCRAWNATSSTTSRTNSGMATPASSRPPSSGRDTHASCAVIAIA